MELEDIKTQIQLVAGIMSKFFIDLETFLNEENAKKENGEEYDEYVVNNAKLAQMHASHSLGELIEVKSCITEDLSPVDKFCKMQYESEMNQAIEALVNKTKLDEFNQKTIASLLSHGSDKFIFQLL